MQLQQCLEQSMSRSVCIEVLVTSRVTCILYVCCRMLAARYLGSKLEVVGYLDVSGRSTPWLLIHNIDTYITGAVLRICMSTYPKEWKTFVMTLLVSRDRCHTSMNQ